jgi:hypothetical protein
MALPRSRRGAEALDPIGLRRHRSDFLGALAKATEIRVEWAVTEEGTQRVDSVAKPLEEMVKFRLADYFAIGTQERGRQEADGYALYGSIAVTAGNLLDPGLDPFAGASAFGCPQELVFGAVDEAWPRGAIGHGSDSRFPSDRDRHYADLFHFFQGAPSSIQTKPFRCKLSKRQDKIRKEIKRVSDQHQIKLESFGLLKMSLPRLRRSKHKRARDVLVL